MALVAYDNSDSSEYENDEEDDTNATVVTLIKKPEVTDSEVQNIEQNKTENSESGPSLFNLLPQPSTKKPAVVEEDDEFLHKKETVTEVRPKTKITVPSLSDFKDVGSTTPAVKPKTSNGKKSGLLSILPQPRNAFVSSTTAKSFIPHVLSKKPNNDNIKKKPPQPSKAKVESKSLINEYSDESDNEEVQNDFFSINKPVELPEVSEFIPEEDPVPKVVNEKPKPSLESFFKKDVCTENVEVQQEPMYEEYGSVEAGSSYSNTIEVTEAPQAEELVLDDEAILKLCGARGKRKREEIQLVDVNQEEVLGDAKEWLLKSLMDDTSKRVSSSKKRGNEPTSQQKRKHQITYLAHQAKANEADLQNQWATNRMTRRKTQSKYGF